MNLKKTHQKANNEQKLNSDLSNEVMWTIQNIKP